jgi:hypothetical protein
MRKFLLVLFMLAVAFPASATVLVYNMKESLTGIYISSSVGDMYKVSRNAYFLVEITGDETAEVRIIWLWKDGKQKYAEFDDWGENGFTRATFENGKETCIVSDATDTYRILFSGASKTTKIAAYKESSCGSCHDSSIGNIAPNIPASLTGCGIWHEDYDRSTSKFTLKLNTKFTLEGHFREAFEVDDAATELLYLLEDQGYEITEWPK